MTQPHYARTIPYDQLVAELYAARAERVVYWKEDGALQLWCYTSKAVYDRAWTPAVMAARGLVLDRERHAVIATALPKFFNVGELGQPVPDEPCEIVEKVDGSLVVIFHDGARWRAATTRSGGCSTPRSSHASRRWQLSRPKRVAVGQGLGLAQCILPDGPRRYLFSYRRQPDLLADNKTRAALLRDINPKTNELPAIALPSRCNGWRRRSDCCHGVR